MPKFRSHKRHHKHKRTKRGFFKKFRKTTNRAIPVVTSGLKTIGSSVKNVTVKSRPVVENSLGTIYKTVLSGFDLGVKGIKKGFHFIKNKSASKTRRHK
jgi:hypothetical protein